MYNNLQRGNIVVKANWLLNYSSNSRGNLTTEMRKIEPVTNKTAKISQPDLANSRSPLKLSLTKGLFFFLACSSLLAPIAPVAGQALLPYTLKLENESLQEQGLKLARDAAQLIAFEQYDLAFGRAKLATQLAPDLFQSWLILGSLYLQREEYPEAVSALETARKLAPDEEGILFALGSGYFRQGNYREAANSIEAGLKKQPKAPEALFDLGNAYFKLGQYSKSIASYEKAIDFEPQFWPAINNVGLVKYEQSDINGAIQKWQKALKIDKQQSEPELALAVALFRKGQRRKAIQLGQKALTRDSRYGDIEFLRQNLWGDRLIEDTKIFLKNPKIGNLIPTD